MQVLAFCGEEVEPPQLRFRGLELSSLPAGVKRLPLQSTLLFSMGFPMKKTSCYSFLVRSFSFLLGLDNESF
ncbi:hypothetical protein AV649_06735 [Rossellomorea marisflavi]|uniref:Uncharacterized protein n=1 Tax=Rossellomorea marisflavi TaxID=189381 RepID=A0A165JBK2_9BACI|nr:hypothetical protein AV649_06735 [Rossellomorea marisflavi]